MKLAFLSTFAALGTAASAAATTNVADNALNSTGTATRSRRLAVVDEFRMVGVDIVVSNYRSPTPEICSNACIYCSATTWTPYEGGTCWVKDTDFQPTATTPKADAESYFALQASGQSVVWSSTRDGFDMPGFDIANTRSTTIDACTSACAANSQCFAVTWTNNEGGTCWLKSRASPYVANTGAKSAFVGRKVRSYSLPPVTKFPDPTQGPTTRPPTTISRYPTTRAPQRP